MPAPDLRKRDYPLGPYRDKRTVAISTDDFILESGFTCQVGSDGNITYRTLHGAEDQTESSLDAGDSIVGPGGVPVALQAVRGTSTVTSIVIGIA